MRKLLLALTCATSFQAMADVYLQSGESQWVSRDNVHCNLNAPVERSFSCSYTACLKSGSIMNTSAQDCEFFHHYKTYSLNTWATKGSEAVAAVRSQLEADDDVVSYKPSTINCQ